MAQQRLTTASEHYRQQSLLVAAGVVAARRERESPLESLIRVLLAFRALLFRSGVASVPRMLDEQGLDLAAAGSPRFDPLMDVASDGRAMATLLDLARSEGADFDSIVTTQLQDAGRVGQSLAVAARPEVTGYVRMLQLPSCSRCLILAGRVYRWSTGFERHPNCDCVHIPVAEATAGDLTTDPDAAYESLPQEWRDKNFSKADQRAIADGADLTQVANARRGMRSAQVFGRELQVTTEGTTRRGVARRAMGAGRQVRLMPESIYRISEGDRREALRLLKLYGYIR